MVLLAAMEYNRVDENDQISVEGTEKKPTDVIHSDTDKKEEREITTDKEKRAIKLDRNVEAAWTNKTEGKGHISCVSWYQIFRFLGETKHLINNCIIFNILFFRKESLSRRRPGSFWNLHHDCHVLLLFSCLGSSTYYFRI